MQVKDCFDGRFSFSFIIQLSTMQPKPLKVSKPCN